MRIATQLLVDPTANAGRTGAAWAQWQRDCLQRLAPAEVALIDSADEAADVAKAAALKGYQRFVAVGGNTVAHGMVNGLMALAEPHRKEMQAGFLSLVRPGCWSRTLELPGDVERQLELLRAGHTVPCDVGKVQYRTARGAAETRYFLNGATLGLCNLVTHLWRREPQGQPWRRRAAGLALALLARPLPHVRVSADGEVVYQGALLEAAVMGGRFYPALGEVAPQAHQADGALDVGWLASHTVPERLLGLGRLWMGSGLAQRGQWERASHVEITTLGNEAVWLDLDGVPLGRLPATFTDVPRTLPMIVESVQVRLRERQRAMLAEMPPGAVAGGGLRLPSACVRSGEPRRAAS